MIEELQAEIRRWRSDYIHIGRELGGIINEQQDIILKLQNENKHLKRENWNLKKTKGRRK
nr:MAG TPA: Protein HEXIM1 T-binding domain (TBD), Cyclin.1A [Caudoviricetes sp.]